MYGLRVRNSVSMETDHGDEGDACSLRSAPSTLTDRNMKTQPMAPSLPAFLSISLFLFLRTSGLPHLIFPSCIILFLLVPVFWYDTEKNLIMGSWLWRNISSSYLIKKERKRSYGFDPLSDLVSDGPNAPPSVSRHV